MLQEPLSVEPVIVVAEPVDAITLRQRSLLLHDLVDTQIVEAKIGGRMWLVMPHAGRVPPGNGGPSPETLAPTLVVFGNWVRLRQAKSDHAPFFERVDAPPTRF